MARDRSRPLPGLGRLASWHRYAEAAARGLGYPAGAFGDAYRRAAQRQVEEALDGDPLAEAVRAYMSQVPGGFRGTATDLLHVLRESRGDRCQRGDGFPPNAKALGHRLNVIKAPLAAVGITVRTIRTAGHRLITLERNDPERSETMESLSPTSSLSDRVGANDEDDKDDKGSPLGGSLTGTTGLVGVNADGSPCRLEDF